MADIVPKFSTNGVQAICDKAGAAIEALVKALPRDAAGEVEIMRFLQDQQRQARAYFREVR